jgi:hypothetical protein
MKSVNFFLVVLLAGLLYLPGCFDDSGDDESDGAPGSCAVTQTDGNKYCIAYGGDFDTSLAKMNCDILAEDTEITSAVYSSDECSKSVAGFVGNCTYSSMGFDYNKFYYAGFDAAAAEDDCSLIFVAEGDPVWTPAE